ncbi:MAG: DinB family protein [Acidobacteriota bacterium]
MKFDLTEAVPVLRQTPDTLSSLLVGLPARWVESADDPLRWRPYDIVGHLIHGEKTDWIPRARQILEEGTKRPFEPFDREAMFAANRGRSLETLLEEFRSLRSDNLRTLAAWELTAPDLDREGVHPDFGRVSLGQLLATWVVHDLNHLFQIARVMARDYETEVGPWIEYLAVLRG